MSSKKVVLLSTFLIGHLAYADSAYVGDIGGCPFENSSNTTESITKVKASLEALAGSSDACGESIGSNASTLSSLLDGILDSNFPTTEIDVDGTTTLTCDNYESILLKEKQLVMDAKNNEYFVVGSDFLSRYSSCEVFTLDEDEIEEDQLESEYQNLSQSQRYDLCVNQVFQEAYYRKVEECDILDDLEYENNKNEAYKAQITQITEVATNLISSSQSCSNTDVLRNITQSIIPLITTIGTYSVSGPFLGAGVALGGNLASALIDRFFNTAGPDEYLELLEGESEWEDLNCLYYQVQNEALACGAPDFSEMERPTMEVACRTQRENEMIDKISDLSLIMKELASSTTPLAQAEKADTIRSYLNQDIYMPDGSKQVKVFDYLKDVASDLSKDPTKSADMFQASRLNKVINNVNQYNELAGAAEIDLDAIAKNNTELFGIVKDSSGTFDLVDTVSRHWNKEQRQYANGMVGRLKSAESASPLADLIPLENSDMQSSESTKIAHDALVDMYQARFETRLKNQQETYLKNRKPKTDAQRNSNLDYLIPIFQSCSLNAGMFHYGEKHEGVHSINRVNHSSSAYNDVCAKFQCPDGSLLPKFEPDNSEGADSIGTQYKRYQCALKSQYNLMYKKLVRNYKSQGEICPAPPARMRASNERAGSLPVDQWRAPAAESVYQAYDPDANGYQEEGGGFWSSIGNAFSGIFDFLFGWLK